MKLIPLTQGKFTQVDDADYDWLMQWKWFATNEHRKHNNVFYAVRMESRRINGGKQKPIRMHREILGLKREDKRQGDHIDHDGLNNQRNNLRICTNSENCKNKRPKNGGYSKYLGVSKFTSKWRRTLKDGKEKTYVYGPRWCANISINGKNKLIGNYKTEIEAASAYNKAAKKNHGKFANLNRIQ